MTSKAFKNFEKFFQSVSLPIVVVDPKDSTVLYANVACEEVFRIQKNDIETTKFIDYFKAQSYQIVTSMIQLIKEGNGLEQLREIDLKLISRSKRQIPITLHANALSAGSSRFVVFCIHDLSEIKRAQEEREETMAELSKLQRFADIGKLAAGVAHELNNPLMIAQGYVETLESIGLQNEITKDNISGHIKPVLKSIHRMTKIVEQMSKLQSLKKDEFHIVDVNEIITEALEFTDQQLRKNKVQYFAELSRNQFINCDSGKISQVLINIINNAIHALEGNQGKRLMKILVKENRDSILLKIWNNGPEIPKKVMENIFTPFYTTKEVGKGTGLGLSVSLGIMKSHKGDLSCKSKKNKGTVFVMKFPKPKIPEKTITTQTCKILVVDDEEAIRHIVSMKLASYKYEVIEACDGQDALDKLIENPDIFCVFTDLKMPRMDGFTFIKEARTKLPEIPIFVIRGFYGLKPIQQKLESLDVTEVLSKPFQQELFDQAVKKIEIALKESKKTDAA